MKISSNITRTSTNSSFNNETTDSFNFHVFQIVTFSLVGSFAIIGNMFIIVLAAKYTVRKKLHHLIINMAVSDILIVLSTWNLNFPSLVDNQFWKDIGDHSVEWLCKFLCFLLSLGMWLILVTLLVISIGRFRATRRTFQIVQPFSIKQRLTILSGIWALCVTFASSALHTAFTYQENGVYQCYSDFPIMVISVLLSTCKALAYISIVTLSLCTLYRLSHQQNLEDASMTADQRKARAKRMRSAIKMVLSSLLVFCCCYATVEINFLLHGIDNNSNGRAFESVSLNWSWYYYFMAFLPIVNSCLSPIIYLIFLNDFREAAKKIVARKVFSTDMQLDQHHV